MGTPAEDSVAIVKALSVGGESYYVEFKSAWSYGLEGKHPREAREIVRDIGETIVAFGNSDGGDLIVGVEDDGAITGVPHDEERLQYLRSWQQQLGGDESPAVRVFTVTVDGYLVLLFRVEAHAGASLITSKGVCLMRKGASSIPASDQQIARRRARALGDLDYEVQPVPQAGLDDLDWELIRGSMKRARRSVAEFDDVALLRYWNLIEQRNGSVILRRAALLLFAKDALRWHANNRMRLRRVFADRPGFGRNLQTREQEEFIGPIVEILQSANDFLHQQLERESREDQLFVTSQLLPREAVDECLVNAIVHRNYAIEGQAVEVLLLPDRVEFHSPGGLPEPITIKDLVAQQGIHRSRNPVMMRVLRDLGWTRDQGEGMARIFGSMRPVELHEPELEESGDTFIVRLSTRSVHDEQTQAFIAAYGPFGLLPDERRYVVALAQAGGKLSVDRLARQLGESFDQVKQALDRLSKRHIVWHPRQSRSYHLVEPLNVPHERVYRILNHAGFQLDRSLLLRREDIMRATKAADQHVLSTAITQWQQAGIIVPAGGKQWKLGESFLAYLDQRS